VLPCRSRVVIFSTLRLKDKESRKQSPRSENGWSLEPRRRRVRRAPRPRAPGLAAGAPSPHARHSAAPARVPVRRPSFGVSFRIFFLFALTYNSLILYTNPTFSRPPPVNIVNRIPIDEPISGNRWVLRRVRRRQNRSDNRTVKAIACQCRPVAAPWSRARVAAHRFRSPGRALRPRSTSSEPLFSPAALPLGPNRAVPSTRTSATPVPLGCRCLDVHHTCTATLQLPLLPTDVPLRQRACN